MTDWHWLYLPAEQAVSLFANPGSAANEATLQWILPGFEELYAPLSKDLPMKGMWNSEKSVDSTYRPALDALSAVDPSLLARALLAVVEDGCAFMVSATRDHGAICLTLLSGNDKRKVYPSNVQELNQALNDLVESLSTSSKSAPPAKRAR